MTALYNRGFLVKRHNVVLKVSLQSNQNIVIEPYNCTQENKRLWSVVAQTYKTMAQVAVDNNRAADPYSLLYSVFDSKGWDISNIIEES